MNEIPIEILEWDSKFFGFRVGKVHNFNLTRRNKATLFQNLSSKNIRLTYLFSDQPLQSDLLIENPEILLVDKKVPLIKKIEDKRKHPKVHLYDGDHLNEELILLAQQAGIHTRFNLDPFIPKEKYRDLFKIWIERSVKKEMATDVLVYKESDQILGFATIQLQDKGPYVSLLAVEKKQEGKGISFALMTTIEHYLNERGYTHVFGATQLDNRKALVVYQRYGLIAQATEYVYHIWK